MNEFLESFGAAAKKVAGSAARELSIAREEDKIRRAYQAIGKLYCTRVNVGEDPTGPEFQRQMAIVAEAAEQIRQLKQQRNVVPEQETYYKEEPVVVDDLTVIDEV